ncbi:hypothetical protein Avbf_01570 [Armadillidium vulgare]|nr:hypothetical protein Avbf_01570 [Armadillidium vulgare]
MEKKVLNHINRVRYVLKSVMLCSEEKLSESDNPTLQALFFNNLSRLLIPNLLFTQLLDEILENISVISPIYLSFVIENHGILKIGIYYKMIVQFRIL